MITTRSDVEAMVRRGGDRRCRRRVAHRVRMQFRTGWVLAAVVALASATPAAQALATEAASSYDTTTSSPNPAGASSAHKRHAEPPKPDEPALTGYGNPPPSPQTTPAPPKTERSETRPSEEPTGRKIITETRASHEVTKPIETDEPVGVSTPLRAPNPATLPVTGFDLRWVFAGGAALVFTGSLMLLGLRRKESHAGPRQTSAISLVDSR